MDDAQHGKSKSRILFEIFYIYFTGMLFSLTGGNMTWPLVQQMLADKYKLMDRETSLEYFALGQSIPGVLSLNTALMIGRDIAGLAGSAAAAAGVVIPAFFGMLTIALLYSFIMRFPFISRAIQGIRAGAIALIASNSIEMIQRGKTRFDWFIIVLGFILLISFDINILWCIMISGVLGLLKVFWEQKKAAKSPPASDKREGEETGE